MKKRSFGQRFTPFRPVKVQKLIEHPTYPELKPPLACPPFGTRVADVFVMKWGLPLNDWAMDSLTGLQLILFRVSRAPPRKTNRFRTEYPGTRPPDSVAHSHLPLRKTLYHAGQKLVIHKKKPRGGAMTSTSESLLIRLRSASDHDAWSRFVQLYTPLIFVWGRRTGLSQHDSADLVQDVLTIVFQKLATWNYRPEKSFRGWLRVVTLNRYREIARRKKLNIEPLEGTNGQIIDPLLLESSWDQVYAQQLVLEAMQLMKSEFAPATWDALQKVISSGRSVAEIAKETGVSVWTIYAARNRLFSRLRRELGDLIE